MSKKDLIRVVQAGEEHFEALNHIWSVVYRGEVPTAHLWEPSDDKREYVALVDGQPAAACRVQTHAMQVGQYVVPCGAVASVGTLPEFRQSGVGSSLMNGAHLVMRDQGLMVSCLYAYREPFYRQFGYASCGWRYQVTCPVDRFPKTECTLPVRRIKTEEVMALNDCYQSMAEGLSGCFLRGPADWAGRLGKNPRLIYAVGDPVEGYFWHDAPEFWGTLTIGEFGWSSRRGYESSLSVIRGLAANQNAVTWSEPSTSPLLARFLDQGIDVKIARPTMFRILDVPGVLNLVGTPKGITVDDPSLPQNNVDGGSGALAVSVGELTQAFLGSPSLLDQAKSFEADISPDLYSRFPARSVVCMDFF